MTTTADKLKRRRAAFLRGMASVFDLWAAPPKKFLDRSIRARRATAHAHAARDRAIMARAKADAARDRANEYRAVAKALRGDGLRVGKDFGRAIARIAARHAPM